MAMEKIPVVGAELYYDAQFLPPNEASEFFDVLLSKCSWHRYKTSFGPAVPRDEAYYGDPRTHYTYSRREYKPLSWIPELLTLKERVEAVTPVSVNENLRLPVHGYNAVLCNLYRDGNDSVGQHADNEPEMGPVIASISLGAERLFRLRGKGGGVIYSQPLPHGSLLIMAGRTQKDFKHEVPKVSQAGVAWAGHGSGATEAHLPGHTADDCDAGPKEGHGEGRARRTPALARSNHGGRVYAGDPEERAGNSRLHQC